MWVLGNRLGDRLGDDPERFFALAISIVGQFCGKSSKNSENLQGKQGGFPEKEAQEPAPETAPRGRFARGRSNFRGSLRAQEQCVRGVVTDLVPGALLMRSQVCWAREKVPFFMNQKTSLRPP